MELVFLGLLLAAVAALALSTSRQRQRHALEEAERLEAVRRVAEEDVTRFGEELQQLHVDTMTADLDAAMRQDYQRALDAYDNAKVLLADATTGADISQVTRALEDGRYAHACVLARNAGEPLPQRRPPCFFNPAHGPAQADVEWAPYGGSPREVPVCLADAERIRAGAEPDARQVRAGNRMVPWYEGGRGYAPYADGYYGGYAMSGLFPGFLLGSMMAGFWGPDVVVDPSGGGDWGGDYGDGGGGDLGGDGGGDFGGDFGDFGF